MKRILVYILRLVILGLISWPIVQPFDINTQNAAGAKQGYLLVPKVSGSQSRFNEMATAKAKELLGEAQTNLTVRVWSKEHPILSLEQLGSIISELPGPIVVVTDGRIWGPTTEVFRNKLSTSTAQTEGRLFFLDGEKIEMALSPMANEMSNKQYLGINQMFLPKISFLTEENKMELQLVGRWEPKSAREVKVLVRQGESILNSISSQITADENGDIVASVQVPIVFPRAGTQTVTSEIRGDFSQGPLTRASALVQVHHNKTTLLHVGVGPDIALRTLRQKLKFWPNLDLLSYYILRETSDDLSIPANELSLIEFPAEKLFGSELPNFHAVIAQNFYFDTYLNEKDNQNLIQYVENGGRFFFQAGPLSFLPQKSAVSSLFPCENVPPFEFDKTYEWEVAEGVWDPKLAESFRSMKSGPLAVGCVPKKDAIVLAQTKQGKHPLLLAMPVGKGIALAALAGDWHYFGALQEATSDFEKSQKQRLIQSSDGLFQWVVEFLQRRQDSGVRPPEPDALRIYAEDTLVPLRSRGPIVEGSQIRLESKDTLSPYLFDGIVQTLGWLGITVATNGQKLSQNSLGGEISSINSSAEATLPFRSLNLTLKGTEYQRPFLWPLGSQTTLNQEAQWNVALWKDLINNQPQMRQSVVTESATQQTQRTPLLLSKPWILAVILLLFFLERYLVMWLGWLNHARVDNR